MEKIENDKKIFVGKTLEEVKMVFEPFRLRIIQTLFKNNGEMTVKQIATEMGQAPNKVHYHVKKLHDFGALELFRTENINGIIAKYYKPVYDGYVLDPSGGNKQVYDLTRQSLFSNLDEAVTNFKNDMVSYMNLIAEQGKDAQRGLEISYTKLYMTKEEKDQVSKQIHELLKQYHKKDSEKEVYTMIHTLTRVK